VHAEECNLVDRETISNAFPEKSIRVLSGHEIGNCFVMFHTGGSLGIHVRKRNSDEDLVKTFESESASYLQDKSRIVRTPDIGRKAMSTIVTDNIEKPEAVLLILGKSSMLSVIYSSDSGISLNEMTLDSLESIGRVALSNESESKLRIGQCKWLPNKELVRFLDTENALIQNISPEYCMASSKKNKNILSVKIDHDIDMDNFLMNREAAKSMLYSKVVDLDEFETTYAYFDSQASVGNPSLNVRIYKNRDVAKITLTLPDEDVITQAHLDSIKPLLHHVYSRF
jgi:hypothetical protein